MANPNRHVRPQSKARIVSVRYDEEEFSKVKDQARSLGLGTSAYIRAVSLDAARGNQVPSTITAVVENASENPETAPENDELREARATINPIAVNYNQIARAVNRLGADQISNPKAVEVHQELTKVLLRFEELLGHGQRKPS